jgi:hypothetical protein
MKAKKALKRLAKIDALMSDVTERYSASAPFIRELLRDAKVAVERAREIVSLQARPKNPLVKSSESAPAEPAKPKRKLSAAGRKAIREALQRRWAQKRAATTKTAPKKVVSARRKAAAKKAAVTVPPTRTARKSTPIKKAAKKTVMKKVAPAQKKVAVKKVAVNIPRAKTAKKSRPIKKAVKERVPKKTTQVPVQVATEAAAQEPVPTIGSAE